MHSTIRSTLRRPKVLDVCCGAGGAGKGYEIAGFDAYGIDDVDMPNYPGAFIQGDALALLRHLLDGGSLWFGDEELVLSDFDFIHASWPCQAHSALTKGTNRGMTYADLIPMGRRLMDEAHDALGIPYVIENVAGAPIRKDLMLCGEMFGLAVLRHRFFEVRGFEVAQPVHPAHRGRVAGMRHGVWYEGPYFAVYGEGGGKGTVAQWQDAMGIHWTNVRKEIAEAIPPAYSSFIGAAVYAGLDLTDQEEVAA